MPVQIIMSCPNKQVCRNSFPNVSVSILTVPSSAEWAGGLDPKLFFQLKTQVRMWQVTHTPPSCHNVSCTWVSYIGGEGRAVILPL